MNKFRSLVFLGFLCVSQVGFSGEAISGKSAVNIMEFQELQVLEKGVVVLQNFGNGAEPEILEFKNKIERIRGGFNTASLSEIGGISESAGDLKVLETEITDIAKNKITKILKMDRLLLGWLEDAGYGKECRCFRNQIKKLRRSLTRGDELNLEKVIKLLQEHKETEEQFNILLRISELF